MPHTLQHKQEAERKRQAAAAKKRRDKLATEMSHALAPTIEQQNVLGQEQAIIAAGGTVPPRQPFFGEPFNTTPKFYHQQIPQPVQTPTVLGESGFKVPALSISQPKIKPEAKKVEPKGLSFTAPFISAPKTKRAVPTVPPVQAVLEEFKKGAPKKADPLDRLAYIFQAIAGVGIDPNSSIGLNLLRIGMASLGGLGAYKEAEAGAEEAFQDELQAFNLQQTQLQQSLAQQEFKNKLATQGLLGEQEQAAFQGQVFEAEQLQPSVKGGFLLQPGLDESGSQVKTSLTALPTKGSETTAMVQKLIAQQAALNPQASYGALLSTPKGAAAVDWAAEQLDLPPQGLGIEWSEQDRAKISQYIQTNEKELFDETVLPYLNLTAGIQALGKRPIK